MGKVDIIFFKDDRGRVPVIDWMGDIPKNASAKGYLWIEEKLAKHGHELWRPHKGYLRDGIHELRWEQEGNQYRILCFFHQRTAVVLSCGLAKKTRKTPDNEIDKAVLRKGLFEGNPDKHTYVTE